MTIAINDRDYSIPDLAAVAGVSRSLIYGYTRLTADPLPTIMHGTRGVKVRWSDWMEWTTRRLGTTGDLRGKSGVEKEGGFDVEK